MPRAHADTEDLDSIAATVNADYARNCGGRLHNNRDLGAIAQAYARSENANDLMDQRYPGQRDGFKGSGDPMAAALTDAYKRGVGNALRHQHQADGQSGPEFALEQGRFWARPVQKRKPAGQGVQ